LAGRLEFFFGFPEDPDSKLTFTECLLADEKRAFPESALRQLQETGLLEPIVIGMRESVIPDLLELSQLLRVLARRDMTLAISFANTLLATLPISIAGVASQREHRCRRILDGKRFGLALTEREHGADLIASEVTARASEEGFVLNGIKWLIGHASHGDGLTVLAKTSERPGDLTLFAIDREHVSSNQWRSLPKIESSGVRGADLGGVEFTELKVPKESVVGRFGRGLETTLKALQISRSLCNPLSMGAADTVMRCAVDFAFNRQLYGKPIWDLPSIRESLAKSFADILIAECCSSVVFKVMHSVPGSGQLVSCVSKVLIPPLLQRAMDDMAEVLGARHLLSDPETEYPIVQKMLRDARIVPVFDGSTNVNLHALFGLIQALKQRSKGADVPVDEGCFDLGARPQPLDLTQLRIMTTEADPITFQIHRLCNLLAADERFLSLGLGEREQLLALANGVGQCLDELMAAHGTLISLDRDAARQDPQAFRLANGYALVFAASACIGIWLFNKTETFPEQFRDGRWLFGVLARIRSLLSPAPLQVAEIPVAPSLANGLKTCYLTGQMFSLTFATDTISRPGKCCYD